MVTRKDIDKLNERIDQVERYARMARAGNKIEVPVYRADGERVKGWDYAMGDYDATEAISVVEYIEQLAKALGVEVRRVKGTQDKLEVWE